MAIKLQRTNKVQHNVNILIYGEAGWGKTHQIGTVDRPLVISAESGLMTLKDKDIPFFEINNREDCNEIYEWLTMSEEAKQFGIVAVDSLSEIAEVLLTDEKGKTKDARQAYGVMNDEMSILIRSFRDLPMDVYFTAKQKRLVDEKSGAVTYIPSVPGQTLLQALPYFFDEVFVGRVGKMEDGTKYRYLQTDKDIQYDAKDRSGTLEAMIEPDLGKAIETIKAGVRLTGH